MLIFSNYTHMYKPNLPNTQTRDKCQRVLSASLFNSVWNPFAITLIIIIWK